MPTTKFDLVNHLRRQGYWSQTTFGEGDNRQGILDHIESEIEEIRTASDDEVFEEWIDIVILGLDGAMRSGATPEQVARALNAKQTKNENRSWPPLDEQQAGKRVEHLKGEDNDKS